jgi:predicted GNAT superfamily acetyltransferase
MTNAPLITVRPLATLDEFHAAEDLQRAVWPGSELEIVPLHVLTTAAHNGGLVLGAFHGQRLVGFVFGFLCTDEGQPSRPALARLKHCSHQMGVLPEYRGQQVGYQLKLAQRDHVSAQGVRLVTWTYDPLESRNARLNIAKLGGVVNSYQRDVYGKMDDGLNAGLASDRFQVDWWITSPRVNERMFGQRAALTLKSFTDAGAQVVNPAVWGPDGLPRPAEAPLALAGTVTLVEIPADFQAVKRADLALAQAWRAHTREVFEAAFSNGYWVTDFFHEPVAGRRRSLYALSTGGVRIEAGNGF